MSFPPPPTRTTKRPEHMIARPVAGLRPAEPLNGWQSLPEPRRRAEARDEEFIRADLMDVMDMVDAEIPDEPFSTVIGLALLGTLAGAVLAVVVLLTTHSLFLALAAYAIGGGIAITAIAISQVRKPQEPPRQDPDQTGPDLRASVTGKIRRRLRP